MKTREILKICVGTAAFTLGHSVFAGPDANPGRWIVRDGQPVSGSATFMKAFSPKGIVNAGESTPLVRLDPWLDSGRLPEPNLYAFVANNPISLVDPDGRKIYNKSDYWVPYKDEHSDNVTWLAPHTNFLGEQDGLVEPSTGKVYKTVGKDKCGISFHDDITINGDGAIGGGDLVSWLAGSKYLTTAPDPGWGPLFYQNGVKRVK